MKEQLVWLIYLLPSVVSFLLYTTREVIAKIISGVVSNIVLHKIQRKTEVPEAENADSYIMIKTSKEKDESFSVKVKCGKKLRRASCRIYIK